MTAPPISKRYQKSMDSCHSASEDETELCVTRSRSDNGITRAISEERVDFVVVYKKQKFNVTFPYDDTVADLKKHVESLTGIPATMQKLMYKGLAKDSKTLRELRVTNRSKMMVIGSTMNDVIAVNNIRGSDDSSQLEHSFEGRRTLSQQKTHMKVVKEGPPNNAMPGIKGQCDPLPPFPLYGMVNRFGKKVRLTFRLELDELWIATRTMTKKIPLSTVETIVNEAITDHEEYHILGLQLGPTSGSRYWIYWVPAQYVGAIKEAILGKIRL